MSQITAHDSGIHTSAFESNENVSDYLVDLGNLFTI